MKHCADRPDLWYRLQAFGLPEILLILTACIGVILLAIPFLTTQKKQHTQIHSVENLRQWGIALNLALPDVSNQLPWKGDPWEQARKAPLFNYAWYILLPPYISQPALDEIPENHQPRVGEKSIWVNPAVAKRDLPRGASRVFFYAMNAYLSTDKELLRISRVHNPSATVFMAETASESASLRPENVISLFGNTRNPRKDPEGMAHFLFCDGRVAAVTRRTFAAKDENGNYIAETRLDSRFTFLPYEGAKPF